MKPMGKHLTNKLTTTTVWQKSEPGRYADGNGLCLIVDSSGAKCWVLRTTIQGKRCDIGLDSANVFSLKDAREETVKMQKTAKGADPLEVRRAQVRVVPICSDAFLIDHHNTEPMPFICDQERSRYLAEGPSRQQPLKCRTECRTTLAAVASLLTQNKK